MDLTLSLLKMCFKKETEYRINFILLCIAIMPLHLLQMVFSWIVAEHFGGFDGWQTWDLIFLYGLLLSTYGITQVFFRQFRYFENFIVDGTLDLYYTKPQPVLYSVIFYNLNIMEVVSQLLPSIVVLILACIKCNISWHIYKILLLISTVITGIVIQSCIFVLIGSVSFWTTRSGSIQRLYFAFKDFLNYPIHVYGKEVVAFLTYILPLAFINYYPSLYILDKEGSNNIINFMGLPVSIFLMIITAVVWKIAQKHYTSTGS